MKNLTKIVLKGQVYATPKTESVEISNQGVLCGSVAPAGLKFTLGVDSRGLE